MRVRQSVQKTVDWLRLMVAVAFALTCSVAHAAAQSSPAEAPPFQSEWMVIGGVGSAVSVAHSLPDRELAFHAIEWGRIVSGAHGPGVLRGRLEMLIEVTPVFVAFQSRRAEGAGFSPLMLRWNFRQYRAVQPYVEMAAGAVATNRDVPEGTTRLNFSMHAGGGARVPVAGRWGVVVGYRFQHLSNGNTAPRNPGVNSHVGYTGIAYRR